MDIIEYLDEDCDAKVTFEEIGETGESVLIFSLEDVDQTIRVYPDGMRKLLKVLNFVFEHGLVNDGTGDIND